MDKIHDWIDWIPPEDITCREIFLMSDNYKINWSFHNNELLKLFPYAYMEKIMVKIHKATFKLEQIIRLYFFVILYFNIFVCFKLISLPFARYHVDFNKQSIQRRFHGYTRNTCPSSEFDRRANLWRPANFMSVGRGFIDTKPHVCVCRHSFIQVYTVEQWIALEYLA